MQPKKFDRTTYHPHDFVGNINTKIVDDIIVRRDSALIRAPWTIYSSTATNLKSCVSDVMFLTEWERDGFMIEYVFHDQRDYRAKGSKYFRCIRHFLSRTPDTIISM